MLSHQLLEEFREKSEVVQGVELDKEISWAILHGLVTSYIKIKDGYSKVQEEKLSSLIKEIIRYMPRYDIFNENSYELAQKSEEYLAFCPPELARGISSENINEKIVSQIAAKVVAYFAYKGAYEKMKTYFPDKGISKRSMEEFMEASATIKGIRTTLIETRGEDGLQMALNYCHSLAVKAIEDEIVFYQLSTSDIIKLYAGIVKEEMIEEENASVAD